MEPRQEAVAFVTVIKQEVITMDRPYVCCESAEGVGI